MEQGLMVSEWVWKSVDESGWEQALVAWYQANRWGEVSVEQWGCE